jgi:hypothetical protein
MEFRKRSILVCLAICLIPCFRFPPARAAELRRYDTRYYELYTDLDADGVREATLRMTRMAEEYYARTREFAGTIHQKFPFYLYSKADDYYAAGGPPGSAGVFMVDGDEQKLMAIAGRKTNGSTWHTVQHEGFHQFAYAVIGGELPVWANEGLAEYFGESIFTGDGFITGVIPPWRLENIKREFADNEFHSIHDMMLMTSAKWRKELSAANYDQAWTMVHFLVYGDGGRYQSAFVAFMRRVGRGEAWDKAWLATLGPADEFEPRWKAWWLGLPPDPTPTLYAQATTAMLTSFLGRCTASHQKFPSFDAFTTAASQESGLKIAEVDWLPPSLLQSGLRSAGEAGTWSIDDAPGKLPTIVDEMGDGTRVVGSFTLRGGHVAAVTTDVDALPRIIADAQKLMADGKKADARTLLRDGIRQYPKSIALADARKLLIQVNQAK